MREIVAEIVALKPDVIVANGSPTVAALKRATSTIPVVFVGVNEPVVQGFIASMARPGGNITGFTQVDFSVVGKSVEMLKAIAPTLTRVGLMYNPETYGFYDTYLERFQAEARWSMELTRAAVRVPADIDVAVADIAARPGGGLAVLTDTFNFINQATIHAALERYRLPHIVPWRQFVAGGGLDVLWTRRRRYFPALGRLRGPHSEGSEPRRASRPGADQVRTCDQSQDREGARPRRAAVAARDRRRGDRMSGRCPLLAQSGHSRSRQIMSAFQVRTKIVPRRGMPDASRPWVMLGL